MQLVMIFGLLVGFGAGLSQREQSSEELAQLSNEGNVASRDSKSLIHTTFLRVRSNGASPNGTSLNTDAVKNAGSSSSSPKPASTPVTSQGGKEPLAPPVVATQQNTITIELPKTVPAAGTPAASPAAPPQPASTLATIALSTTITETHAPLLTGTVSNAGPTAAALPIVSSPTALVGSASQLPGGSKPGAVITLGDSLFTAGPNGLAIGPTTLAPGGAVANVGGQIVSVGLDFVIVDGSVIPYTEILPPPQAATFSLQGQIYTAAPTGVSIGSVTLKPGEQGTTISGQYVSAGSRGVVVGKNTISFTNLPPMTTVVGGVFTLGSTPYTYMAGSGMVVGGHTLVPGGPGTVISGIPISVAPSGVVVGTDSFVMSTITRTLNGMISTYAGLPSITTATGSPTRARLASLATGKTSAASSKTQGVRWGQVFAITSVIVSAGYWII